MASMLSLKLVLISTGVLTMAMALKVSVSVVSDFVVSEVPSIWSIVLTWLRPPYLYIVINCIIISIVASSKLHTRTEEDPAPEMVPLTPVPVVEVSDDVWISDYSDVYENGVVLSGGGLGYSVGYDAAEKKVMDGGDDEAKVMASRPVERKDSMELSFLNNENEKPPVSARFAHRKAVKASPEGEGMLKNVPAEGRTRRVLQDIGNMVAERAVEVKLQAQPIARAFCTELIANAQTAAEKNKLQKPIKDALGAVAGYGVVVKKGGVATKVAAAQKIVKMPNPEEVIVISSDEEDEGKCAGTRKSKDGPSRKNVKTLTAILTARSKAACGITKKPKDLIENIDAADVDNELAVAEYVDEMYKFFKETEDLSQVHDYMIKQTHINAKRRSILVDWLIEVHRKFELTPETLYLTINIVDRFLSIMVVSRRELKLVGISSMLIASKYEETRAPEVNDFVCISDNAYLREQILVMEKTILEKLEWLMTVPTPYVFLVRYIKASVPSDKQMENMVFFLAELGLLHYPTITSYCPSKIAASAVYAARCTLDNSPFWNETLEHYTGYSECQLKDCAELLVILHSVAAESKLKYVTPLLVSLHPVAAESKLKAVHRKFTSSDRGAVALLTPAKSLSSKSS